MSIKLASLNVRGLKDSDKLSVCCVILSFEVDVTEIQETHFVCDVGACMLSSDFVVYSAYGNKLVFPC